MCESITSKCDWMEKRESERERERESVLVSKWRKDNNNIFVAYTGWFFFYDLSHRLLTFLVLTTFIFFCNRNWHVIMKLSIIRAWKWKTENKYYWWEFHRRSYKTEQYEIYLLCTYIIMIKRIEKYIIWRKFFETINTR